MKKIVSIGLILFVGFLNVYGQNILKGYVYELVNEEKIPLPFSNIYVTELKSGTATDINGNFELKLPEGTYTINFSFVGYLPVNKQIIVNQPETYLEIVLKPDGYQLEEVKVVAQALRKSEGALQTIKKESVVMMDGISFDKIQLTGDATAIEAAKRITGVSIEGGKYIYVRGLGDRYSKTSLNQLDIPGLDPDRNSIQLDIFPTNLIDNILVSKNFTADMPADFTGGLMNIETKDLPEKRIVNFSVSTSYNPDMHFNPNYLSYKGGKFDFLGFDDGTRALPEGANSYRIPTPISGASQQEVRDFVLSFNPELGAKRQTSLMDFGMNFSIGDQIKQKKTDNSVDTPSKLGYIFSLSYKSEYNYYNNAVNSEYQRYINPDIYQMRYATIQEGEIGERNVLVGVLGGLSYKTASSKLRLTALHLQNGESRAAKFRINNDGEAVGQSGYLASSDNLEYNQRSLTNVLLNGNHTIKNSEWKLDWRIAPTLSTSNDPDIRKTAFTFGSMDTSFAAGAGGNPSRIWRELNEVNLPFRFDVSRKYTLNDQEGLFKIGVSHTYKYRSYRILFFDMQFFGNQNWTSYDPSDVLSEENIYPNQPNSIYYQSGNNNPNPNEYQSNSNNTGFYIHNELNLLPKLKSILGIRVEKFVQRHTGRDQIYSSGDEINGENLENEKVLDAIDFFPSVNLIYAITTKQNLRAAYSKTIARPSFKELSFAQILDPLSNRIFNGSFFEYSDWDGNLTETKIDNLDFRWEVFMENNQTISFSTFYKKFINPIELVRIPEQQTSTEYQPRNVGNGQLFGLELEFRKDLGFIASALHAFNLSGNITLVKSSIDMTEREYNSRLNYKKTGESIANTRQMAGQSPYVINLGISYTNKKAGIESGLFYNAKGTTLSIVGGGLFPDVYLHPFHSLNFSFNKSIGKEGITVLDFSASNILNQKTESYYHSYGAEDQLYHSLNSGRSFSFGISYKF